MMEKAALFLLLTLAAMQLSLRVESAGSCTKGNYEVLQLVPNNPVTLPCPSDCGTSCIAHHDGTGSRAGPVMVDGSSANCGQHTLTCNVGGSQDKYLVTGLDCIVLDLKATLDSTYITLQIVMPKGLNAFNPSCLLYIDSKLSNNHFFDENGATSIEKNEFRAGPDVTYAVECTVCNAKQLHSSSVHGDILLQQAIASAVPDKVMIVDERINLYSRQDRSFMFTISFDLLSNQFSLSANITVMCEADPGHHCPPNVTLSQDTHNYTFYNLSQNTTYSVTLFATNRIGSGEQSTTTVTTPLAVPEVVNNITVIVKDDQDNPSGLLSAMLKWEAPSSDFDPVKYYYISCVGDARCFSNFTTSNATEEANVTGLSPSTNYTIYISAVNSIGNGEFGLKQFSTPPVANQEDNSSSSSVLGPVLGGIVAVAIVATLVVLIICRLAKAGKLRFPHRIPVRPANQETPRQP